MKYTEKLTTVDLQPLQKYEKLQRAIIIKVQYKKVFLFNIYEFSYTTSRCWNKKLIWMNDVCIRILHCFHWLIVFILLIRLVHPFVGSTTNVFRNKFLAVKNAFTRLVIRNRSNLRISRNV